MPLPSNFRARTLHLIDVENLLGGTYFGMLDVIDLEDRYRGCVSVGKGDFVIVASGHPAAAATWFGWSPTRRLLRSGISGADRALVEVVEKEDVDRRFEHVVIGSGDGIFARPAARLQAQGCRVSVVAQRPGTVSRELAFAVRDVAYLDPGDNVGVDEVRLAA